MTDLDWPEHVERTPADERKSYPYGFDVTRSRAFDSILEELRKMDARNVQLDSGAEHQVKNPNKPYADASFDDPGIVVRYELDGVQHVTAMDKWDTPRDNARAIALTFDAQRSIPRYGVETIESEFSTHQLPPPDDAVVAGNGEMPPHEVLGVEVEADEETVRDAARERKIEAHPDHGGSSEELQRVLEAEEVLLG